MCGINHFSSDSSAKCYSNSIQPLFIQLPRDGNGKKRKEKKKSNIKLEEHSLRKMCVIAVCRAADCHAFLCLYNHED